MRLIISSFSRSFSLKCPGLIASFIFFISSKSFTLLSSTVRRDCSSFNLSLYFLSTELIFSYFPCSCSLNSFRSLSKILSYRSSTLRLPSSLTLSLRSKPHSPPLLFSYFFGSLASNEEYSLLNSCNDSPYLGSRSLGGPYESLGDLDLVKT